MNTLVSTIASLLETRRTTSPKRLTEPGPTADHLVCILQAASHAPDHGQLTPWRFVVIPQAARFALGAAFRQALLERDASASTTELAQAEEKAQRSPLLLAAVLKQAQKDRPEVPDTERLISQGCAIQNMLLTATALGYGSALTSGKALSHPAMRHLLSLAPHEVLTCFVNIGTASRQPKEQLRPPYGQYTSNLTVL
jgi:nitroreductase